MPCYNEISNLRAKSCARRGESQGDQFQLLLDTTIRCPKGSKHVCP